MPVKPLNNVSMSIIFLWLKTRGGHILTAEVAKRRNSTRFSGFVQLQDPGIYEVHALVVDVLIQKTFNLTQAGGSPGVLRAARSNQEINRSSQRWAEKRRCQLGVDQVKGRWMQIPKASECNFGCARDRWYYVSTNCHWHIHSPREIHEMTRFLPEPLWLVMIGTSVTRGSFQSLVDSLVPEAWELTAGVKNIPGEGTSVKCWGWLDFQVGGLRLSFQDFRFANYEGEQVEVAVARLKQLLSEGPDLLVIEIQGFGKRRAQWANIFQSVLLRHFDQKPKAKVILKLRHNHPSIMCPGGSCMTWGSSKSWNRTVETFMFSLPASLRSSAIGKLIAVDESPVSLPLFLDVEGTVQSHSSTRSSAHWHRYDLGKTKGRKVFGTAADVWGHLYLTELLRQLNYKPLQGKSKEKKDKSPHIVAGCAQCRPSFLPIQAVPENVTYTLTAAQDLPLIGSWRNLTMQSCGQLVLPNDENDV